MTAARALAIVMGLAACGGGADDELVVPTDAGDVRGVLEGNVRAFHGVPYAAPPVGANRWRPPQPVAPWDGEANATIAGPICPQGFGLSGGGGGDEDCLFLNVWTPSPAPEAPLPVMVWIHGGAFQFGAGSEAPYAGNHLVETQGVIVVSINYRLGALGFLAHPALAAEDPAHPTSGNYGILDQIAALEWVQRNIAAFGGDPARVAIFGESAGGYSGCLHYLSPRAGQLFHAVISESGLCGSAFPEPIRDEAEAAGMMFATELACSDAACLRAVSAGEIVEAGQTPPTASQLPGGLFYQDANAALPWGPHADGLVVPVNPGEGFAQLAAAAVPLLLGTNRDEGQLFHAPLLAVAVADEAEYEAALERRFGQQRAAAIAAEYPVASFPTPNDALAEVSGDAVFVCAARRTARAASAAGAPVYLYTFQREPERPLFGGGLGVYHAAEIPFVFGIPGTPLGDIGAAAAPLGDAMQRYWTTFAATGAPAGDVAWPRYDAAGDAHLTLDVPITAGTGHKAARCDFWDSL